jgi:hypothetical protein
MCFFATSIALKISHENDLKKQNEKFWYFSSKNTRKVVNIHCFSDNFMKLGVACHVKTCVGLFHDLHSHRAVLSLPSQLYDLLAYYLVVSHDVNVNMYSLTYFAPGIEIMGEMNKE